MSDQGAEYASFIRGELDHEYARRDVANARAGAGVTSASGLITLALAVVAVLKGQNVKLQQPAEGLLIAGLLAFLVAGILAVLAGMNWKYKVTSPETLKLMTSDQWADSEVVARHTSAYCNITTISTLRSGNNFKSGFLLSSGFVQVGALLALTISAFYIFL